MSSDDWQSKRASTLAGVILVAAGWAIFFSVLGWHGLHEPYDQRLEEAWAVQDQMNSSHWASITRSILAPVSAITAVAGQDSAPKVPDSRGRDWSPFLAK
jgi:hypothetical protein